MFKEEFKEKMLDAGITEDELNATERHMKMFIFSVSLYVYASALQEVLKAIPRLNVEQLAALDGVVTGSQFAVARALASYDEMIKKEADAHSVPDNEEE